MSATHEMRVKFDLACSSRHPSTTVGGRKTGRQIRTPKVKKGKLTNLLCLMDFILATPASTATCEWGYSTIMGWVKTAWRAD